MKAVVEPLSCFCLSKALGLFVTENLQMVNLSCTVELNVCDCNCVACNSNVATNNDAAATLSLPHNVTNMAAVVAVMGEEFGTRRHVANLDVWTAQMLLDNAAC